MKTKKQSLSVLLFIAILLIYSGTALAQMSLNSDIVVNAQRSVDGKQYKIVANKHAPYASSLEYLSIIPPTRRHVGQIGYVANGNKIDVWQFVGGIADSNFNLVSIKLPANNATLDSILTTDANGAPKLKFYNPAWNRAGNAGTSYLTDFLGTTDNKSLRFRTNNKEHLLLDSLGLLTVTMDSTIARPYTFLIKSNNASPLSYFKVTTGTTNSAIELLSTGFVVPDRISSDYISTWQTGWTYGQHRLRSYYGLIVEGSGTHDQTPVFLVKKPAVVPSTPLFMVGQDGNYFGDSSAKVNSYLTITPPTPKGILIPRLSRTNRNALDSSTTGLLIYNTTANYFEYSAGGRWKTIGDTSYRPTAGSGPDSSGNLVDADYGDITVSLGGTAMNIDDSVINAINIHDVAASTITGTRDHTFISDFSTSKVASADSFVTSRNIYGYPFNGTADLSGIISSSYLPSTIPYYNQVNNFGAGLTQTFQSSTTTAGFRLTGPGGDPSSLIAGNMWYNLNDNTLRYRANATTRLVVNTDESQLLTNKILDSVTTVFPIATIARGGTGQKTANAGLNALLPSQTSNAGKVLQTDGAGNTSWKVKVDSIRVINDSTLRTYSSNGTSNDIILTDPAGSFADVGEQTISPTISFTSSGGTNPSGTTNNTYQWSQSGKMVTVRFNFSWGTAGTGTVSAISFNKPSDLPTPKRPTGFTTATDYLYIGDGYLTTTKNSVNADRGRSFIAYDGTNYTVIIKIQTAAAIQYGYATIQYFVP